MSAPQSVINICSGVRLDNRYEHSIYFATASAQESYFAGKVVKTFSACSYLRKSWSVKVEATMEQAKTWNYLFFRNTPSGKVYYYFINEVEYVNDFTVMLTLELDVLQTYMFNYTLLDSFVERQHTETDVRGEHTLDEGLEVGDYIVESSRNIGPSNDDMCILVMTSVILNGTSKELTTDCFSAMYGKTYSSLWVYATDNWTALGLQLERLSEWGKIDGVVAMWMYPKVLVDVDWDDEEVFKLVNIEGGTLPHIAHTVEHVRELIDGYEPKNQKTFCYPYSFLYVTNNTGESAVYRWERFETDPSFRIYGAISPSEGARLVPRNYNGVALNYEEGVSLAGYPSCAWECDTYKLWLAQNQNQHALNNAVGGVKIVGGIIGAVAGGPVGAVAGVGTAISGASQIANSLAEKKDRETEPPQARGTFSTTINAANGMHAFFLMEKTVDAQHAKCIDDYFTMYGYKLNRVQKPNINARPAFTYVKTIGCHIKGEMCTEDITKIESIFDTGVTFWKNGDKIADYSQNNAV